MEKISVSINDPMLFDNLVHNSLPEGGDLLFVTKDEGTEGGRPCIVMSFTVELPDSGPGRVQAVVPLRLFLANAMALKLHYDTFHAGWDQ